MIPIEWIVRQDKYSSLKTLETLIISCLIFYYGVIAITISRFSYFGCFAWTKHWIQSMSCYFAMECFYLEFLGDSGSGHDKTSFLGLKWVLLEAVVRSMRLRIFRRKSHECLCQSRVFWVKMARFVSKTMTFRVVKCQKRRKNRG